MTADAAQGGVAFFLCGIPDHCAGDGFGYIPRTDFVVDGELRLKQYHQAPSRSIRREMFIVCPSSAVVRCRLSCAWRHQLETQSWRYRTKHGRIIGFGPRRGCASDPIHDGTRRRLSSGSTRAAPRMPTWCSHLAEAPALSESLQAGSSATAWTRSSASLTGTGMDGPLPFIIRSGDADGASFHGSHISPDRPVRTTQRAACR